MMKTDVLIIGGGITARRAARIVAEKYSVTLVSDGAGASPYIHGLNVPLLDTDSTELFYKDTVESGKWQNDPSLAEALTEGSRAVKAEFAADFDKTDGGGYELLKPLGSSVPRVASIGGRTGAGILRSLIAEKRYTELESTRALSLIKDGEKVVGAMLFDRKSRTHYPIFADAVLIATGGFGGIFRFSTNSSDIGGDGCSMAYLAGAELVDMEFIQYEPTVAVSPKPLVGKSIITTMLFEGAVMRNARGERFMDEKVGKYALSLGIAKEIARGGGTENGGVYYDMTSVPKKMLKGKYKDYFTRYKNHGIDIGKTPVEIVPAPHTTMGGIRIDRECHTTVSGLFAAGEAAGGVHGANRLGGNAGLEVLVFGDIAGLAIVRFLDKKLDRGMDISAFQAESAPDEVCDVSEERQELQSILDGALGVERCESSLAAALPRLDMLITSVSDKTRSFDAIRLRNDAVAAKLAVRAALERNESVGSHVRADFPLTGGEKYCIILKNESGDIAVKRQILK